MAQQSKNKWWIFLTISAIIISIIVLPKYVKQWMNTAQKTLKQDYISHLFIVQHDYVYKATMEIEGASISVYLIKNAGDQFDIWDPGATVNRINAAAFMIDSNGVCITSRYATEPWKNDADETALKKLLSKEAGISEDMVTVSGMTVKLTIQSAVQLSKSNKNEIDCIVYNENEDGKEIRYIGRVNNAAPLPLKKISLGNTYLNNLEKGKPLYALAYPNIDFSSGLPFETKVIKLAVEQYTIDYDSFTSFEKTATWLPEGTPVFDNDLNLVGVYTSVNAKKQSNYICNLIRHDNTDLPENLHPILDTALKEMVKTIPVIPNIDTDNTDATEEPIEISIRTFWFKSDDSTFYIKVETHSKARLTSVTWANNMGESGLCYLEQEIKDYVNYQPYYLYDTLWWSAGYLKIKPGNNIMTFTATNADNNKVSVSSDEFDFQTPMKYLEFEIKRKHLGLQ